MKKLLLAATAAIAFTSVAPAIAQVATQAPQARMTKAMKPATRAEVGQKAQRMFARLDTNRDGFLTEAETQAGAAQRLQKRADRGQKRAARRDPAAMFARLDANRDGQVTRAEADAARSARAVGKNGQPARAQATASGRLFERGDANKDGTISRAEFDSLRALGAQRLASRDARRAGGSGRLLARADLDRDGRVSLQEMTGASLQRFDSADLNRDGTLTAEERRQARQLKRQARVRPG